MKLLTFLTSHFGWTPFSKTLPEAANDIPADAMDDAIVVFMQIEAKDIGQEATEEEAKRVFRHTLKHIKWLANKKGFRNVVLHSFAHLGGDNAIPEDAEIFIRTLKERLENTDYRVKVTPFGWFCSWDLNVLGDSLAKVWKEV